jgi:hypothetical protein
MRPFTSATTSEVDASGWAAAAEEGDGMTANVGAEVGGRSEEERARLENNKPNKPLLTRRTRIKIPPRRAGCEWIMGLSRLGMYVYYLTHLSCINDSS